MVSVKTSLYNVSEKTQKPQHSVLLVFISTMFLQSNVDSCKYFWKTQHVKMSVFAFVLSAKDFQNCLVLFIYRVTGEGLKCLSESHWASSWVIVCESKSICYVLPHHCWPSVHVQHMKYTKTLLFYLHIVLFDHWNFYQVMQTCANLKYYYTILVTILKVAQIPTSLFSVISMQNALLNIVDTFIYFIYFFILTTQENNTWPSFATFLWTKLRNRTNLIIKCINTKNKIKTVFKLRKTCVEQGSTVHFIGILIHLTSNYTRFSS